MKTKIRRKPFTPIATIPDAMMLSWVSQAIQYPAYSANPGISHERLPLREGVDERMIDCVLFYDTSGHLVGILNHYPADVDPWEKKGNVNLWVHPQFTHRGIGTRLVEFADKKWGINWQQQRFSPSGAGLARNYLAHKETRG